MIQRVQTLYIVLGSIICFFLFSEITTYATGKLTFWLYIQMLSLALSLLTIFSYKNRKRQIKLLYSLVSLLAIFGFFLLLCVLSTDKIPCIIFPLSTGLLHYIGLLLAIIFYIFAINRIKKDDDLIKSIDRIR